jgi:uncharacterized protein YbbC (DUF1343 family)
MMIGLDALHDDPACVRGRRVGVVTNHTGLDSLFQPTAAVLAAAGAQIAALFGPEHGYDGLTQDALFVDHATRRVPGVGEVPVYSLYRSDDDFGLPPGAVAGLDLLVFDMQDVGSRYYTYLSTLGVVLEAGVETGLPLLVLDRPNPLGGTVEGPGLDADCRSFVGRYDIPVRHGLTLGEAARYINQQYLGGQATVTVLRAPGWHRDLLFPATGLPWIAPSPNIPTFDTALVYPGTCLFEGTTLSEGRGTTRPFELVGAPWIDPDGYAATLNGRGLPGVRFRPARFIPTFSRYANQVCGGVQVHATDVQAIRPVALGLHMIVAAKQLYPEQPLWREPPGPEGLYHFDRLIGSRQVRPRIEQGAPAADLMGEWPETEQAFRQRSAGCLLYN